MLWRVSKVAGQTGSTKEGKAVRSGPAWGGDSEQDPSIRVGGFAYLGLPEYWQAIQEHRWGPATSTPLGRDAVVGRWVRRMINRPNGADMVVSLCYNMGTTGMGLFALNQWATYRVVEARLYDLDKSADGNSDMQGAEAMLRAVRRIGSQPLQQIADPELWAIANLRSDPQVVLRRSVTIAADTWYRAESGNTLIHVTGTLPPRLAGTPTGS